MLRVRADEPGAFEQLVLLFQQRLVAIMKPMVGSREEAEDLAQEAFLRVYKSRKNYHPTAKFSTWLFTIANNLALNSIRSKKRRPQVSYLTSESGQQQQVGGAAAHGGFGDVLGRQRQRARSDSVGTNCLSDQAAEYGKPDRAFAGFTAQCR